MRLIYAALYDPRDPYRGSGTSHHLCRELERQGHTVLARTPPPVVRPLASRAFGRLSRALGQGYRVHQDPLVGRRRGAALGRLIAADAYDALLTNDASIAAYTAASRPIVLYTDAIFPPRYRDNVHPWLDGLSPLSVVFSQRVNRRALQRSRVVVASRWAADLVRRYRAGADPVVIPYGANLETPPAELVRSAPRSSDLSLLFVGKDWALKGGALAVATVEELRRRGHRATLHVVGATVPREVDRALIVDHGQLDKSVPAERRRLDELYRRCDALLLPSRAEGFGIVFAEAAAYALPSLALRTTGVETAVADGESGVLLPLDAEPAALAAVVESWLREPEDYLRLSRGARRHYTTTVSWPVAVERLTAVLEGS